MLHFESIFWQTSDPNQLAEKLKTLGFTLTASSREPQARSIYFGPESLELIDSQNPLSTLDRSGDHEAGVVGLALESTNLAADYKRLSSAGREPGKLAVASTEGSEVPLWYGFAMPKETTPLLAAWLFTNAPEILEKQKQETLPLIHENTCIGIESIHLKSQNPEEDAKKWQLLLNKNFSGLTFNELSTGEGHRFQLGERFLDFVKPAEDSPHIPKLGNVMMVTLKVTDLERAKEIAINAGAIVLPCRSRDGFVISSQWTGGPALRFVRSFWKKYLPPVSENYPDGRRTDQFRPLGGANSTTLEEGFVDNWKH